MAWGPFKSSALLDATASNHARVTAAAGPFVTVPESWGPSWDWATTGEVSRAQALSVPSLARAVDLLATTFAQLPPRRLTKSGKFVDIGWVEQPEAGRSRWATLIDTGRDLILDGRSYWLVRGAGYPTISAARTGGRNLAAEGRNPNGTLKRGGVVYVPLSDVQSVEIDGSVVALEHAGRYYSPADVIGFEGWHDGIRRHGADIIRTALALEHAARRYAETPLPSIMAKNTSAYELDDAEISALIANIKKARNESAIGYTNAGVDLTPVGWDAGQLQLVEARQYTSAQIANLVGVPAHYVAGAAAASGGSMTYSNVSQEARNLIDFGLRPLLSAVESRLSMPDVATSGSRVRFSVDDMLRGNPLERAQLYSILIPLGVMTVEEARGFEELVSTPDQTTGNGP